MKNDNISKALELAKIYDKKYGVITYSGSLAIELLLKSLNLNAGDKILISNNVCYSIINAIKNCNYNPVIICPENDLVLTSDDVKKALELYDIKVIILVHQYGIVNDIKGIRSIFPNGIIIEDIAQAWDIKIDGLNAGYNSDYLVTSFGKTKPLSYGIGGAIFSNSNEFLSNIDFCDNESRNLTTNISSYAYPLSNQINMNMLIKKANKIVKHQRNCANIISEILKNNKKIDYFVDKNKDNSVWHRFPIWTDDKEIYVKLIDKLNENNIEYQLPHMIELKELYSAKNSLVLDNRKQKKNFILLRTRDVSIDKLKSSFYEVIEAL